MKTTRDEDTFTSASWPAGAEGAEGSDDEPHVVPWLLARLAQSAETQPLVFPAQDLEQAARHLTRCAACWSQVAVLAKATSVESLRALLGATDLAGDEPCPSDEELAAYATLVAAGRTKPSVHTPSNRQLISHLDTCPRCQQTVEDTVEALGAALDFPGLVVQPRDVGSPVHAASEIGAVPQSSRQWTLLGSVRRLVAAYEVRVREHAVRITSALARPQIATVYAGPVRFRGARAAAAQQLEQSFAVDLCEDLAASTPWVRARVALRALSARRVSGKITTTHLVGFPEDEGERAAGIAWRLEQSAPEGAATPALRGGTTDAEGEADFYVRGHGAYALTFSLEGREWVVPLIIQPDPGADDTASAAPS